MFVNLFRLPDDRIHAVVAAREKVKRNGSHRTVCQQLVEDTAVRIAPRFMEPERAVVISCDTCLEGTTF